MAMILAGGGLALVYQASGADLRSIVAVYIGASASLILGTLISQAPDVIASN
jgi:hypothetical protein